MHERAVRIVADANVSEPFAEVAQHFVWHADDAKVERLAEVVVRVRRVLRRRERAKAAHELDLPTAEVIADHPRQRDEARVDGMHHASRAHHLFERLQRRRRNLSVAILGANEKLFAEAHRVNDVGLLRFVLVLVGPRRARRRRDRVRRLALVARADAARCCRRRLAAVLLVGRTRRAIALALARLGRVLLVARLLRLAVFVFLVVLGWRCRLRRDARDDERVARLQVLRVFELVGVENRLLRDVIAIGDGLDGLAAADDVGDVGARGKRRESDDRGGDQRDGNGEASRKGAKRHGRGLLYLNRQAWLHRIGLAELGLTRSSAHVDTPSF